MTVSLQHDDSARALARLAYETLEPYHVVAYFNPHQQSLWKEAELTWHSAYVGGRGGPLGATPASVVAACFFNFSPAVIAAGWDGALGYGLDAAMALREKAVDRTLRDALGESVDDPELREIAQGLRVIATGLGFHGRPLAAAWSCVPWPEPAHLMLWQATAVLREWRGDGHIAVLVGAGFEPVEACVFHEASHPDPTVRKRSMGRTRTMRTRGWDDDTWRAAAERLASRGLLSIGDDGEALTPAGGELYDAVETATDDAAVWTNAPDAEDLLVRARPYVKKVIDAGVLPGTGR